MGTIVLTYIGLYINSKYVTKKFKENRVYLLATIGCAIYVITQEFKLHNLGGNNVFDINDVLFSIIGLVIAYLIVHFIKPTI